MLMDASEDGCYYEFEWHTAAACVLSRTEGDNCTVLDSQAGAYPVCPAAPGRQHPRDLRGLLENVRPMSVLEVACFRMVLTCGTSILTSWCLRSRETCLSFMVQVGFAEHET